MMKLKALILSAILAFMVSAPVAQASTPPSIAELRQQAIDKTYDAIQFFAAKRKAAAAIIWSTPRFSKEWFAAKDEYRYLSRQIFYLQRKWIRARYERRRGVLEYYYNYAQNVISAH